MIVFCVFVQVCECVCACVRVGARTRVWDECVSLSVIV